jgi:peroxiredoxin
MKKIPPLDFNDPAPDVELATTTGEKLRLSALWAERPLLLAFTRHFGCTQCKEMLDHLTEGCADIERHGLGVAIITQGAPATAAEFCAHYAPHFRCCADPDRAAYRAYRLERGTVFQTMINPKVWKSVQKAGQKGYHLEPPPPGQDALQMSGTFIIACDGRIRLPYYYDHIADHPPLSLLLEGILTTDWNKPFDGPLG